MTDIKEALNQAIVLLNKISPSARLDAEILLAFLLGKERTFLYSHPEKKLDPDLYKEYQQLVTKRYQGQPIAYLINHREFWSLPLQVNQNTLIPRPETELLVELTLTHLQGVSKATIIDLGTGSGAIALALATERPDWQLLACDINQAALDVAHSNAIHLGLKNIKFYRSNWFSSIPTQQFHAIVSNPPYIAKHDPHLKQGDVRFEPREALVSGIDGLEALFSIIKDSYDRLLPKGLLLLEHGFDQKFAVTSKLTQCGYQHVNCWQDWQGIDRVSGGWRDDK